MPCSPFARGLGSLTSTASENPPRKATKALHFSARPPSAGEARPGLAAACVAGLETPHRSGAALGAPGGPSPPGRAGSVGFRGVTGSVCQQPPPAPQPRGRGGAQEKAKAGPRRTRRGGCRGRAAAWARPAGGAAAPTGRCFDHGPAEPVAGGSGGERGRRGARKPGFASDAPFPDPAETPSSGGRTGERRRGELVQTRRGSEGYWRSGLRKG